MVSNLQNKYHWICFIPGHLISKLYVLLTSKPPQIDKFIEEVTYAFPHEADMVKLKESCTVSPNFGVLTLFANTTYAQKCYMNYSIIISAVLS